MSIFDKLIRSLRNKSATASSAENEKAENENIAMMSVDSEENTSWVNIDTLPIQDNGVQVGRLLVPFESIVEIRTPKFLIGVHPKGQTETSTVELAMARACLP